MNYWQKYLEYNPKEKGEIFEIQHIFSLHLVVLNLQLKANSPELLYVPLAVLNYL